MLAKSRERLPHLDGMRAANRSQARTHDVHGLRDGREMWVSGEKQLGLASRSPQGGGDQARFASLAAGEDKLAASRREAVELGRVIQGEDAALHVAAGREFREDGRQMAADALDSAGGFEFGEETDDHAPSLPSAAPERKPFRCGEAGQFPGRPSSK